MTLFSDLTPDQAEQVGYLFADEFFGKDPAAYDYEIGMDGQVICRAALKQVKPDLKRKNRKVALSSKPDPYATHDQVLLAENALDQLAHEYVEQSLKRNGIPRLDTLSANSRLPLTDPIPVSLPSTAEGPASAEQQEEA